MNNLESILALPEGDGSNQRTAASIMPTPTSTAQGGDSEIEAMKAEFDLLALIQSDTGEQGQRSGNTINFDRCPVCGHHDCFRYYPDTDTWCCFSNSNASEIKGGSCIDYLRAVHQCSRGEAINRLKLATGRPIAPQSKEEENAVELPPWTPVRASDPPMRSPVLIDSILRVGHIALLTGKGKGSKTWSAIQCAIAVATGGEWFGFKCMQQGNVLYIDPELDPKSLDNRFAKVCEAMGADRATVDMRVKKWSLRGVKEATMDNIVKNLKKRCHRGEFSLVVIDSASAFVSGDENSSIAIREFSSKVLRVATLTGAAVLLVHHMGKGNKGDIDPLERSRGSSVWGDFPDAPLILTEIFPPDGQTSDYLSDGDRAFVLEDGGLREFPSIEPRQLIFSYPIHEIDESGVTEGWGPKGAKSRAARESAKTREYKAKAQRSSDMVDIIAYVLKHDIDGQGIGVTEISRNVFGSDKKTDRVKEIASESDILEVYKPVKNRCNIRLVVNSS